MPECTLTLNINQDTEIATATLEIGERTVTGNRRLAATGHTVTTAAKSCDKTIVLPENASTENTSVHPTMLPNSKYGVLIFTTGTKTTVEFENDQLGISK